MPLMRFRLRSLQEAWQMHLGEDGARSFILSQLQSIQNEPFLIRLILPSPLFWIKISDWSPDLLRISMGMDFQFDIDLHVVNIWNGFD